MKKIFIGILLATCTQLSLAKGAILYAENFDNLDPKTDAAGSSELGGPGQLEDLKGTTWSGTDTDFGYFQTRVLGTTDRNLHIYTHAAGILPQLTTTPIFPAQHQTNSFSFYFNLESWGLDNHGAGNDVTSGRLELGLHDSTTSKNIFGIEMGVRFKTPSEFRTYIYDYTGGMRIKVCDTQQNQTGTGVFVSGSRVGSIALSYNGKKQITLTVYSGPNQTGTIFQQVTGITSGRPFNADSFYIRPSTNIVGKPRTENVKVDDLTLIDKALSSTTPPTIATTSVPKRTVKTKKPPRTRTSPPVIIDISVSDGVVFVTATNLLESVAYNLVRAKNKNGPFSKVVDSILARKKTAILKDISPPEGEVFYKVQKK